MTVFSTEKSAEIRILLYSDAADISKNKFSNLFTLPSGNLRESMSGLRRADIIIQNNKAGDAELPADFRNPEKIFSESDIKLNIL